MNLIDNEDVFSAIYGKVFKCRQACFNIVCAMYVFC